MFKSILRLILLITLIVIVDLSIDCIKNNIKIEENEQREMIEQTELIHSCYIDNLSNEVECD